MTKIKITNAPTLVSYNLPMCKYNPKEDNITDPSDYILNVYLYTNIPGKEFYIDKPEIKIYEPGQVDTFFHDNLIISRILAGSFFKEEDRSILQYTADDFFWGTHGSDKFEGLNIELVDLYFERSVMLRNISNLFENDLAMKLTQWSVDELTGKH